MYDLLNSSSTYSDLLKYYENQGNNAIFNILVFVHRIYFKIIYAKIIYRVRYVGSLETWPGRKKQPGYERSEAIQDYKYVQTFYGIGTPKSAQI